MYVVAVGTIKNSTEQDFVKLVGSYKQKFVSLIKNYLYLFINSYCHDMFNLIQNNLYHNYAIARFFRFYAALYSYIEFKGT